MKLILSAVDESLAMAWQRFCEALEFVEIHHGSILDVPCDAVVSPANSFGFMDGGVDAFTSAVSVMIFKHAASSRLPSDIMASYSSGQQK